MIFELEKNHFLYWEIPAMQNTISAGFFPENTDHILTKFKFATPKTLNKTTVIAMNYTNKNEIEIQNYKTIQVGNWKLWWITAKLWATAEIWERVSNSLLIKLNIISTNHNNIQECQATAKGNYFHWMSKAILLSNPYIPARLKICFISFLAWKL